MTNTDKRRILRRLNHITRAIAGKQQGSPRTVSIRTIHPVGAELVHSEGQILLFPPAGNRHVVETDPKTGRIHVHAPFGYMAVLTSQEHILLFNKKALFTYRQDANGEWKSVPNDELDYLLDLVSLCELAGIT